MAERYGLASRPVFVGGLFKSGTSLTRVLLGQHPDLFASFETYWFVPEVSEHWDRPEGRRLAYLLEFYGVDQELYERFKATKRAEPGREFVDIVLEHARLASGKPRWVEKTPGNIVHIDRIHATWKDARVVLCTRDFRDTFASWKARRGNTLEEFIAACHEAYDPLAARLGKPDPAFETIDYSELIGDTESAMRRVLSYIDEPWDPRCASINLDDTRAERSLVHQVTGRDNLTLQSLAKPIFTSSLGQWREILTQDEAAAIESEFAAIYAVMGERWHQT